ncbi:MAG TPA: hypothetical protein VNT30_20185 [Stellaceae bacterium]|nr:hypothetical protein [Stellaceae bacterium]
MALRRSDLSRRNLLALAGGVAPIAFAGLAGRSASALTLEKMPAPMAKAYIGHCQVDQFHAVSVDDAIGKLKAAGIVFDEQAVRSSLVCPLCGCSIVGTAEFSPAAPPAKP